MNKLQLCKLRTETMNTKLLRALAGSMAVACLAARADTVINFDDPTLIPPTYTWSGADQASSYDLVITKAPPPYGDGSAAFAASVAGTSYQLPAGILQVKTYYAWYMYSFNSAGDQSARSAPLYFETP